MRRDPARLDPRAAAYVRADRKALAVRIDGLLTVLLGVQGVAAAALAAGVAPAAWGPAGTVPPPHAGAALAVAAAIGGAAVVAARRWPGQATARHALATAQMGAASLLIHLTHGRLESHVHVFVSLALLTCYRDPRVLATATAVAAIDAVLRGTPWPVAGIGGTLACLAFESGLLGVVATLGRQELEAAAVRRASLEAARAHIQGTVRERTAGLAASEARFHAIVQHLHEVVSLVDAKGRPLYTTRYDLAPDGDAPSAWLAELHPDDAAEAAAQHRAALARPAEPVTAEVRRRGRDGSWRWVESTIRNYLHHPHLRALLVTSRDVTVRKQAEQAMATACDRALEATRAKSQFLANMSHEIRTPLHIILGYTEMALEDGATPELRGHLERIRHAANGLAALLQHTLDLARLDGGALELHPVPFDVRDVVAEVVQRATPRARAKRLALAGAVSADVPAVVLGDRARVREVLGHLVANAVQFTDAGRADVLVSLDAAGADGDVVLHAAVSDTGIGVPPHRQQAIFEPFTQADGSMTRPHGGAGLGLAIATRLVELIGGRIWLETDPGHGSIFHTTFRLAAPPIAGAVRAA
jgi:two-component system sensor histidine kinase/response regulator